MRIHIQATVVFIQLFTSVFWLNTACCAADHDDGDEKPKVGRVAILPILPSKKIDRISHVVIFHKNKAVKEDYVHFDEPTILDRVPAGKHNIAIFPVSSDVSNCTYSKAGLTYESCIEVKAGELLKIYAKMKIVTPKVISVTMVDSEDTPLTHKRKIDGELKDNKVWLRSSRNNYIIDKVRLLINQQGKASFYAFPGRKYQLRYVCRIDHRFPWTAKMSPVYTIADAGKPIKWAIHHNAKLIIRFFKKNNGNWDLFEDLPRIQMIPVLPPGKDVEYDTPADKKGETCYYRPGGLNRTSMQLYSQHDSPEKRFRGILYLEKKTEWWNMDFYNVGKIRFKMPLKYYRRGYRVVGKSVFDISSDEDQTIDIRIEKVEVQNND